MLQGEHFATLSTFIKLPFAIKMFALSMFEWPLKAGFTVYPVYSHTSMWVIRLNAVRIKKEIKNKKLKAPQQILTKHIFINPCPAETGCVIFQRTV